MVKFTASGNGVTLIGLGLEAENIRRMQSGQPVRVRLSDMGFTGTLGAVQIAIFVGEDVASIRRDLSQFIDADTVVIEEPVV